MYIRHTSNIPKLILACPQAITLNHKCKAKTRTLNNMDHNFHITSNNQCHPYTITITQINAFIKNQNLTNVFHSSLIGWWKYSLNFNTNQLSHRNYQSVLNIPNKFNISNNNQEDFKACNGLRTWNIGGKILWPCGAKNPGNIGLLPTTTSLLPHHPPTTPTYITFNSLLNNITSNQISI